MADLETTYMGLTLENPVVMASCGLVSKVDGVKRAAAAGAGAVVLKSLFEEQIRAESADEAAGTGLWGHPEAQAYLQSEVWMRYGPRDYCKLVEDSKKAVEIPIIASVNCVGRGWWTDYAKDLESSGADAIELNILVPGTNPDQTGAEVEQIYFDVVSQVASQVKIPVAAKIGFSFASIANVTRRLVEAGAKGLVIFNRFHRPDIDIEDLELKHATPFSDPVEMHYTLRWIGLLSGKVGCDIAATTGLHQAEHAIKALLAGARVVQVCSTVYRNGFPQIGTIVEGIDAWMNQHEFDEIQDFRGSLSVEEAESAAIYERLQYIKHLVEIH
jgi:dihydroorotate dehydrogenase (fumarate)